MKTLGTRLGLWAVLLALTGQGASEARGEPPETDGAFIIRLVRPDRQAAEVLRLFEGSRATSPAAALRAWKQEARNSRQLGKPLEAVIAMFNPEMVREWQALDGAELHVGLDPADGLPHWFVMVPHDDGTAAAVITASRLTYPDVEPLKDEGREIPVARLGRSGVPVACRAGSTLIVGSSRVELLCGLHAISTPTGTVARVADGREGHARAEKDHAVGNARPMESGLSFRLDPERMTTPRSGAIGARRAVEALHGIDCRRAEGTVRLKEGRLRLEMATTLKSREPSRGAGTQPARVDPAWLARLPSTDAMAIISLALDPQPAFWDRTFALIDRVERADPARAGVAPFRTRLNLLALAAGLKPEADLWPHLRGMSACIWGERRQPGHPIGAVLVLHLDKEPSAARLAAELVPRLGPLLPGAARAKDARADDQPETPRRLGTILGRPVTVWQASRNLMIAWGDDALTATLRANVPPARSLATVCDGWAGEGRGMPQRLGAIWPGRLRRPDGGPALSTAMLRVLDEGPPVVWWGWSDGHRAFDLVRWSDLAGRVRLFLEALPLAPLQTP